MSRASVLALLLAGCSAERRYQSILDSVQSPGVQMTVLEASGGGWSGSAGLARADQPLSLEDSLLVGSHTKMFTAAVVLQLVGEGRLSLEDPAFAWVPQLDEAITVRSLLQHTSGLGEYSAHEVMTADGEAAMEQPWEPLALIALGQELASGPPGELVQYANTNYIALGLIVEDLEGEALDQVFDRRIVQPLGLQRTGLLVSEAPEHLAWGEGGAWGEATRWDPSVGGAAGALYASTADLARFLQAVFDAELYSEELLAEQLEPGRWDEADAEGVDLSYGLGMMVVDVDGALFYGHQGGLLGFTSLSILEPDSGAVVSLATNGDEVDAVTPAFRAMGVAARR
jgi:D-alanyl-D-alanine carboxypeptidase